MKRKLPIILVPGIFGSKLLAVSETNTQEIWYPSQHDCLLDDTAQYLWGKYDKEKQVFVSYMNDVYKIQPLRGLNGIRQLTAATQQDKNVPILKKHNLYFGPLIDFLQDLGYVEEQSLFAFPYDWRQDTTGAYTQNLFKLFLEDIYAKTKQKITIIAHSMGGILTESFIKQNQHQVIIDKFIAIGTPFNGSGKGFSTLTHFCLGINPSQYIKIPYKPCPSNYQLSAHIIANKYNNKIEMYTLKQKIDLQHHDVFRQKLLGIFYNDNIKVSSQFIKQFSNCNEKLSSIFNCNNLRSLFNGNSDDEATPDVTSHDNKLQNNKEKTIYSYFPNKENQQYHVDMELKDDIVTQSALKEYGHSVNSYLKQFVNNNSTNKHVHIDYLLKQLDQNKDNVISVIFDYSFELYEEILKRRQISLQNSKCVKFYNIAGFGIDTKRSCSYDNPISVEEIKYNLGEFDFLSGDGIVTIISAQNDDFDAIERVCIKHMDHGDILKSQTTFEFIKQFLDE